MGEAVQKMRSTGRRFGLNERLLAKTSMTATTMRDEGEFEISEADGL